MKVKLCDFWNPLCPIFFLYHLLLLLFSPPHWTPCPAHCFANYFLGCTFSQSLSREPYQEREFNVQEGSSVRGWECSCLAKTFHCSRSGSELAAKNSACCPSLLWSSHSLFTQLLLQAWSLFISIPVSYRVYILHFQNHWFNRILSLSTNEPSRVDRVRRYKTMTSVDFNQPETLFIWNIKHQMGMR